ncbi:MULTISPECIES: EAL domain-containing protein [unclassified Colwellia]|uniref:EAL domain-containing protein n=1 Tax=unclassified Colwellia TaxID=196834 RepID=UPI0015F55576|nr:MULTISPECIES: EAL domain-containing protein [unclassified Colwellia]MBA6372539.1 EAL domain-containing protein [Colwellia sp. BRX8-4]MBA6379736.1 EAL domain-containing protein [Colwellia sp. BRX10-7]MBA6383877.1 EAL domain-containing protein [Colwellia sp. BRX10-9]MBA6388122.1 EAL domain-containing protein [Colwellia sp. BRX10-2]MBA6393880.1 EAL domain-containing protein [Colwellia sp. BRX10-6]
MGYLDKALMKDEITAGILTLNANYILVAVNTEYLLMTGLDKTDLLGYSIDKIHKFSADKVQQNNSNPDFGHFSSTLQQKDNRQLPVDVCFFSLTKNNEEQTLLFFKATNYNDITKSNISIIEQIFNHSNEAIVVTDNQGYIQIVNKGFSHITGYTQEEVWGKTPAILSSGKQDKYFYKQFWQKLINEGGWQGEIWNKRKNGEIYPEWLNISSIKDSNGHISNYICQFTDITSRKKSEEEVHFHAYHDTLTSLPNRHLLFEKLEHLSELHRETPTYFAVLFCDLDRFKSINDSLGHEVGDELLKSVANRLNAKLRDNDIIARSGGDEFIVVVEGEKSLRNLDKICEQILSLFEKPFKTKFGEFKTTISIGVSTFPLDSLDVKELISFADVAMMKVKKSGGNYYSLFDTKEKELIKRRMELDREIYQAIENKQFEVWYQPQINADNGEVYGIECLLRWIHPEQGIISPALFIPIAEANGAIKELGHFVLKSACRQLRVWRINNLFTGVMAINISLRQFDRNDLFAQVQKVLTEEMIPGNAIELEVTESLFSEDNNHHTAILVALRELGVKIAIDDFGTGYSSLQRLKSLPIDNVKIDKCFVDNIVNCPEDRAIVMALILLSKTFNVSLIAEGIETQEQADKLCELGCSNHQGFLYSKPLSASDFEKWLLAFKQKNQHNAQHKENG